MGRRRKRKEKPKIVYPPVTTRKWIPPDKRKKRPRPKPAPYPPQMNTKLALSSLKRVWHAYDLIHECAVLIGHCSQSNRKYCYLTNGFQGAANCVMAVLFSKLLDCAYWNAYMLDAVLNWGDRYYVECRKQFKNKECLRIPDLLRELYVFNHKIFIDFHGDKYKVLLYRDSNPQDYLENAIKNFFVNYDSGVIATPGSPGRHFAIWRYGTGYFLFDPTDHDKMCWPWKEVPGMGFSFLVRFTNTDKLVQVVQRNLPPVNIELEIFPVGIERIVSINTRYPYCLQDANLEAIDPKLATLNRNDSIIIKKQPKEIAEEVLEIELPGEDQDPDYLFDDNDEEEGAVDVRKQVKRKVLVEKPRVSSVTYFNYIVPDRIGILLGETHQDDPDFQKCPGKQGISNAISALTMLRQLKSKYWTTRVLTQVLRLGYRICRETKRSLPLDQEYSLKNIFKRIELNEKSYTPHITHFGAVGRLISNDEAILELLPAMKEVLSECDTVIIQGPLIVAVWKEDGYYYMFDPNERDPNGFAIVKEIRVGSVLEAVDYISGVACLTWFLDLKDLIDVYMVNVKKDQRRDPFIISNVEIKDYIPLPDNWGNFKAVAENRWILRGNFSQSDRKFDRESRNTQCTANCVMAIAYAHAIPIINWTTETMDTILMCGNDYYVNCVENLKRSEKFISNMLMLAELTTEFIADNKLTVIDINECIINGFITIKDDFKNTLSLKKGLVEFFKDNDFGILTCRGVSLALFRKGEGFFYFDSHDRDKEGFYKPHGKCCIQRFTNTDEMAEMIMGNLGPAIFHAIFNLSRIDVSLYKSPPPDAPKDEDDDDEEEILENDEAGFNLRDKFNVEMPVYNYDKITKKRAILLSNYHQKDAFFGTNAGKQTIPNLISAIATSRVFDPRHWNKERLDEVLIRGNELYDESMDVYYKIQSKKNIQEEEDEDESDDITMENVVKQLKIGINKFKVDFEPVVDGGMDVNGSVIIETLDQLLKEDPVDINDYKEIIIHTDMVDVVVWKHNGLYYLFDPMPRNERGEVFGKEEWSEYEPIIEEDVYDYEDDTDFDEEIETITLDEEAMTDGESPKILTTEAVESYLEKEWTEIGEDHGEEKLSPKHPQEYWDDLEARMGKACVIWFSKLKLLIKHILGNNPPKLREGYTFQITKVHLINEPDLKETFDSAVGIKEDPISGDWHSFKEITKGEWILRGTLHQKNAMFPESNRGKQGDAISLLAVAFAATYGLSQFTHHTVDRIVKYGDRLYTHTKKLRRKELEVLDGVVLTAADIDEIVKADIYTLDKLVKNICIGDDSISLVVDDDPIIGEVHAEELEDLLDVKRALDLYFSSSANQYAILCAKGNSVGLWKIREYYYMFDPYERGPHGYGFENGVACITRFMEVGPIAELFIKNLPKKGKNFFTLFGVRVILGACNKPIRKETLRVDDPLKVIGFSPVARGKMIVRGTTHQDHPRFGRGNNAQCSPIAMVALAMTLVHSTEYWTQLIIDENIIIGDKIYGELLEKCDFDFNPWEEKLSVSMSPKDFKIGKIKVNCETRLTEQRGIMDTKDASVLNLRQGIERFFEENSYGIIETTFLTVAIWEPEDTGETNYLYMFDPNERSQTGQPTQDNGTACCMKFCGSKYMSDHIVSLVQHDRDGSFVITPIEIVIERDGKFKKTKRYGIDKKFVPKEDLSKQKLLGRHEFYKIPGAQCDILRGSRSQVSKHYPDSTRGYQDLPNCIISYVMDKLIPLKRWNCKTIDMILDVGDQLYKDSYMVYDPSDKKLRMETLVRDVVIRDVRVTISVGAPIIAAQFQVKALMEALEACFNLKPFCIVLADQSAVSIFKKDDLFYLFDPMDLDLHGNRVEKGSAAVLRFEDMAVMVIHLMKNMQVNGQVKDIFHIIIVGIKEIKKVGFKFGEGHQIIRPVDKCICDKSMYGHLKRSTKSKLAENIAENSEKL